MKTNTTTVRLDDTRTNKLNEILDYINSKNVIGGTVTQSDIFRLGIDRLYDDYKKGLL